MLLGMVSTSQMCGTICLGLAPRCGAKELTACITIGQIRKQPSLIRQSCYRSVSILLALSQLLLSQLLLSLQLL